MDDFGASIFQNEISQSAAKKACRAARLCKSIFGACEAPIDFVAVPKGEVFRDFNVMTLVPRSDALAQTDEDGKPLEIYEVQEQNSIIIGTIRMGFGHWRIAIALASAAHSMNVRSYLLDLMSLSDTPIGKSIKFMEHWYNKFSRLSQKSRWFNEHIWESVTSGSNATLDSAIQNREISRLFSKALGGLPKSIPLVAAHPWVAWSAALAGMKRVVTMVPDNLPLAFWLVENTVHTIQSPSAYMGYRTLFNMEKGPPISHCLKPSEIIQTGHYVDYELVTSIEEDCKKRIERLEKNEARRFLLTMGGAGAQALKFAEIADFCKEYIEQNRVCLLINMGDHEGRWNMLKEALVQSAIPFTMHSVWQDTRAFIENAKSGVLTGVHIFLHSDFYAAVYCTNLLMHISDVMITKPSELSFYPVPKLFIQRVGRHEAWGAIRGSEIGDGTMEASNPQILHRILRVLVEDEDLLKLYVRNILNNNEIHIYDGAYNVVKIATSGN